MCTDQATKWPEAVPPLRNVTARTIAHEMMTMFSRTGILKKTTVCSVCGKSGIEVVHWVGDRTDDDYSL